MPRQNVLWSFLLLSLLVTEVCLLVLVGMDEALMSHGHTPHQRMLAGVAFVSGALLLVSFPAVARSWTRTRAELERRMASLEAASFTSDEWLWESDANGIYTESSDASLAMLGYPPDELVGRSILEHIYDPAERVVSARRLGLERPARPGPTPGSQQQMAWGGVEVTLRHRDGRPVWFEGSIMALTDARGRVFGYRGARRLVSGDAAERAARSTARQRVAVLLGGAVADDVVSVALQPIIDVPRGRVVGAEALARFSDGRSPDQWFREAAQAGLTRQLDELTFTRALEALDALPQLPYLSVNANPALLLDPAFRRQLMNRRDLDRLVIEVTEHERVGDYAELNDAIAGLRGHGVRFAIDDTGAGYASLNHVLRMRPDIIKLDRELISDLDKDRARRALVTALVLLALEVGASVTGEGVETLDQLCAMNALGVEHAQGYYLARPTLDRAEWRGWFQRDWTQVQGRDRSTLPF